MEYEEDTSKPDVIGNLIDCKNDTFSHNYQSLSSYRTKFFIPTIKAISKQERTDLNWSDENGNTALHNLVEQNAEKEIITLLYDLGAKIDIANKKGETPIDIANKKEDSTLFDELYSIKLTHEKSKIQKLASEESKATKHTERCKKSNYLKSVLEQHLELNSQSSQESLVSSEISDSNDRTSGASYWSQYYLSAESKYNDSLSESYKTAKSR